MAARRIAVVNGDQLHPFDADVTEPIVVGSPAWFVWLDDPSHRAFSYQTEHGSLTVRRERKGNGWYWYAYAARRGKLRKAYLGKSEDVTPGRLQAAAAALADEQPEGQPTAVRLSLFGAPSLERNAEAVAPLAAKALALLAYLGVRDTPSRASDCSPCSGRRAAPKPRGKTYETCSGACVPRLATAWWRGPSIWRSMSVWG